MNDWDDLTIGDLEAFLAQAEKDLNAEKERYLKATKVIRQQMNYASEVLYKKAALSGNPLDKYWITLKRRTKELRDV